MKVSVLLDIVIVDVQPQQIDFAQSEIILGAEIIDTVCQVATG